ncbi:tryptophan synthase subunit alpha [Aliamphritea spongicola]|uniref:tryptophan synthase subunit alpha n=1 Tax=Aliamphritea spongicola TaxID=707589 RepID=UPI00196B8C3E|nr:tryptophan synthase subunit alpha [Aliamphritea spongicola]MBN3561372.1 tryptophan synthase subunit alpha [Aliamphritea spongicola]
MSRISSCFDKLQAEGRKALIPYVTAGDPAPGVTLPLMHAMVESGADIIELGVPFSDPMADGPVIQLACERALSHNTSLQDVLAVVAEFRKTDQTTPVVLMGYLNPIEVMGYEVFAQAASDAGVDGVLTVDLPPEEAVEFGPLMKAKEIDVIYLLAPTTVESRIEKICAAGSGYVYYVSVKGVTGSASLDVGEVADRLDVIRKHTDMPVGVGFGIRDDASARAISEVADGVIVGSVLVNKIAELADQQDKIPEAVAAISGSMRQAMDK